MGMQHDANVSAWLDAAEEVLSNSPRDLTLAAYARTALPQAVDAIDSVLDLHYPVSAATRGAPMSHSNQLVCNICPGDTFGRYEYPCPTVQALGEALGER